MNVSIQRFEALHNQTFCIRGPETDIKCKLLSEWVEINQNNVKHEKLEIADDRQCWIQVPVISKERD